MCTKKIYLHIFLCFLSMYCIAQPEQQYSKAHGDSLIQGKFHIDSKKEAEDAVASIVRYTGLTQNFLIVENPSIPTAIAYIKDRQRYIAYNPQFMLRVK